MIEVAPSEPTFSSSVFMVKTPEPAPQQPPTFETAIERLEAIVDEMESDKLPLEDLLIRYEEGLKLVKFCSEKLTDAEKRIEIITRTAGGKPVLASFDPAEKSKSASAPDEPSESPGSGEVSLF
jgi:exodeoxyribonuclease VII small subunit